MTQGNDGREGWCSENSSVLSLYSSYFEYAWIKSNDQSLFIEGGGGFAGSHGSQGEGGASLHQQSLNGITRLLQSRRGRLNRVNFILTRLNPSNLPLPPASGSLTSILLFLHTDLKGSFMMATMMLTKKTPM